MESPAPEAEPASTAGHLPDALRGLRYQQALEAGRIGTWWLDVRTGHGTWDAIAAEILGLDVPESYNLDRVHPDDRAAIIESIANCARTGCVHDMEFRPMRSDGDVRWIRAIARPSSNSGFGTRWITGVMFDVTDRRRAEDELRENRRQLTTLLNNLPGVAYRCEAKPPWRMDFVSNAVRDITGYTPREMCKPHRAWADLMHPDDMDSVIRAIEQAIAARRPFSVRYRIIHRSGSVRWVHERGEASFNDAGEAHFIEGFIWDVSEQQAADERLQWTALHDGLTRLPNRVLFQQRLEEAFARTTREGGHVGILLIDLDDFKMINDTLGHDAGDALLRAVADRLSLSIRPGDTVARLSGDEFAVLVDHGADRAIIQRTGTKIMAAFEEAFSHAGQLFECRASLGLSMLDGGDNNRVTLMKNADIALYAAKAEGGARMRFYEPRMRDEMDGRSSMLQLARDALLNDWIVPYYQPKIDLVTGQISGFEALLRWEHPTKGLQAPETITAAFQDFDVAASISDRMIKLIIADLAEWEEAGLNYGHVAVNAAAAELRRSNFPETLLGRLGEAQIPANKVQIEVTESVFLGRGAECIEVALRLLSASGVAVALDDFGTGYASLSHLKQFPVNAIKIDRSFVRDLQADPDDAAIVRALIGLGRSLGINVIAEGVETQQQAAYLRKHGCDYAQGFLFGVPVPACEVPRMLASCRSRAARSKKAA
jgi:diguanylate cyclase (GGDEF)-like protein/PAS domain S-box-containing protein